MTHAEEVFQKFFGLKHSPYDLSWADSNYKSKDQWIEDSGKMSRQVSGVVDEADGGEQLHTPVRPSSVLPTRLSASKKTAKKRHVDQSRYNVNTLPAEASETELERGMFYVLAVPVRQGQ